MAELITITEEDILNAQTYTPITAKELLARAVASLCIEPVEVKSNETDALPPMFRENRKLRHQFQMGILATLLHREYALQKIRYSGEDADSEHELTWCMDEDEYDLWAMSHVMNQLERMKKSANKVVVNRLFDFLYDYKAIELMLTGAIRDELEAHNDIFNRAMQFFSVSATQAAMNSLVEGELRNLLSKEGEAVE